MMSDSHSTVTTLEVSKNTRPVDTTDQNLNTTQAIGRVSAARASFTEIEYIFAGRIRQLDYPLHPGVAFSARGKKLQWCGMSPTGDLKWFDVPTVTQESLG